MERRIEFRPAVEVFVNDANTITIRTEDLDGESLVSLHPDQVPTVIQWLRECLDELESPEDLPPVPTPARYAQALASLRGQLSRWQVALLDAHYHSDELTASAAQLAAAAGLPSWHSIGWQYSQLGTLLCREMNYTEAGSQAYIIAAVVRPSGARNADCLWVMHPELAEALESLGWVKNIEPEDSADGKP